MPITPKTGSLFHADSQIVPDLTFLSVLVCTLAKGSGDCEITRIP